VVEPSTVARQAAAVDDTNPLEQPGPPPTQAGGTACAFDLRSLCALALYFSLSIFFFGRPLFKGFSSFYIGTSADPALMMWLLVWWPHAIAHGLNPMLTRAVWAPHGLNLAWQTGIPLACLFVTPLTLALGPVATFNVLCLLSLPLSGWCAFIPCRYLAQNYWTSLLGGYVFGFSAYMLGQLTFGHLHMLLVFPVPLAVYLAARRLDGAMTARRFALSLAALLVTQFLLSIEIFATMTIFAALAWLLGWGLSTGELKERLAGLLKPIVCGYGIALILVSPYLYYFFAFDFTPQPLNSATLYSADLLNFIIPSQANALGQIPFLKLASVAFNGGNIEEVGACLGLPLIAIAVLFACRHPRGLLGKGLVECLIVTIALSLGPVLHVAGSEFRIALPWLPFSQLPILNSALPVRFSMYSFLILALIVSLWLAIADTNRAVKIGMAVVIVAFNLPNPSGAFWTSAVDTPAFFSTGLYRHYLQRGEIVVVLPYADAGNVALWQAQANMYFAMAEGSAGARPEEFHLWPIIAAFHQRFYLPEAPAQLKAFLAAHSVAAIIVADQEEALWQGLLSTLGATSVVKVGGVSLYRLDGLKADPDSQATLLKMSTRFDSERFVTLVTGAHKYLSEGGSLASLSVLKARDLDLIPRDSLLGPSVIPISDARYAYGLWLGERSDGRVGVGEFVWYPAVAPLIERLRGVAGEINFPDPVRLSTSAPAPYTQGWLMMVFTREQLARAAALLAAPSPPQLFPQISYSNVSTVGTY
jgi:hypothetical protein